MLDLDRTEMSVTLRSAVLSADQLRQEGAVARAERLESLARILERELARTARSDSRAESSTPRGAAI
jgi:hypothetical protein